jgi:hypothetical protein
VVTELLYFVSGGGSVTIGGETLPLTAESVVHVPRGTPYVIKAAVADKDKEKNDKVLVVQLKASNTRSVPPPAPARAPQK